MKITNSYGLPQSFVEAASGNHREMASNEFSVTELNKGVKEIILSRRHRDEIEVDVINMLWAIFGQAFHSVMERGKLSEMEISEASLSKKFHINGKEYILSGQFDLYNAETKMIDDWKTSLLYSIEKNIKEGRDSDWFKQTRGYFMLLIDNGFECVGGRIIPVARDWSIGKVKAFKGYSPSPIIPIEYKFYNDDYLDALEFYQNKLYLIDKYIDSPDDEIPDCLPEERWEKNEHWAIWREGNKRVTEYFSTRESAEFALEAYNKKGGKPYSVVYTEQTPAKCLNYCSCREQCSFYKQWMDSHGSEESTEMGETA